MDQFEQIIQQIIIIIMGNPHEQIINLLVKFFPFLDYIDDVNRIYLANKTICIAKNREGNKINAHEFFCSLTLQEYFIQHYFFSTFYFNMSYGIIRKPFFIPFNKDENSQNLNFYQIYGSFLMQKGFSLNPDQNKIGILNGKLVLSDYSNFIPYIAEIQLKCMCGLNLYGGLEPFCPRGCDINLTSNIKLVEFYYLQNLKNRTGGF